MGPWSLLPESVSKLLPGPRRGRGKLRIRRESPVNIEDSGPDEHSGTAAPSGTTEARHNRYAPPGEERAAAEFASADAEEQSEELVESGPRKRRQTSPVIRAVDLGDPEAAAAAIRSFAGELQTHGRPVELPLVFFLSPQNEVNAGVVSAAVDLLRSLGLLDAKDRSADWQDITVIPCGSLYERLRDRFSGIEVWLDLPVNRQTLINRLERALTLAIDHPLRVTLSAKRHRLPIEPRILADLAETMSGLYSLQREFKDQFLLVTNPSHRDATRELVKTLQKSAAPRQLNGWRRLSPSDLSSSKLNALLQAAKRGELRVVAQWSKDQLSERQLKYLAVLIDQVFMSPNRNRIKLSLNDTQRQMLFKFAPVTAEDDDSASMRWTTLCFRDVQSLRGVEFLNP